MPGPVGARERSRRADAAPVEPRSDPAAEAALKRRVERQIRDAVGSRLRSYDVRVEGRQVTIWAHTTRFWQRRGVKHALESLPVLTGYKATVHVDE
jgi:hypothetical protein